MWIVKTNLTRRLSSLPTFLDESKELELDEDRKLNSMRNLKWVSDGTGWSRHVVKHKKMEDVEIALQEIASCATEPTDEVSTLRPHTYNLGHLEKFLMTY